MITSLSLKNFKASSAAYAFEPGNLIQGDNFAGKSAIDQAIRCLVLGYVPGVSKTASGLKMFASDYPMVITATAHGAQFGPTLQRGLRVSFEKVKSTIKQTGDETLAGDINEPTRVLFDPTIFFGLSDAARISKACELVQSAGMKPADIDAALTNQIGENPNLLRHLATWRTKIKATAQTVPDLLTASEDFWAAERKIVSAEKDRMQSTVEGVADLGAAEIENSQLPAREEVAKRKTELEAELRQIRDRISTAVALSSAIAADQKRAAELAPVVAANATLRAEVGLLSSQLAALQELQGPADQSSLDASGKLEKARAHAATAEALRNKIAALNAQASKADALEKALNENSESVKSLRAKIASLQVDAQASAANLKEAREAAANAKPPRTSGELRTDDFEANATPGVRYLVTATATIGAAGFPEILSIEDWKELIENADEIEEAARAEEYETAQRIAELTEEAEQAAAAVANAESSFVDESNQLREALANAKSAKAMLAELATGPAEVDPVQMQSLAAQAHEAAEAVRRLRIDSKTVSEKLAQARHGLSRAEAAAAELGSIESKTADRGDILDAAAIASLRENEQDRVELIKGCASTLDQITAAEADQKRIASAAARRTEVEAEHKLLGSIIKVLKQKKTELVSVSIEAPLAVANTLAAGILKGPLVFEEGEIGMRVGDSFVSARVFSGTETAIVMMGLTAGLAANSELRVLILDEVGRLTTNNAVRLMQNLRGMVTSRSIDQFFLIGPTNEALASAAASSGVNVISL